jgi:NTP pyrophosphatase (non-canonical NTP hydrolase)
MADIKDLTKQINKFVSERDWDRFQTPKDLAISVSLEAAELLEHFQWKNNGQSKKHVLENKEEMGEELADVAIYLFNLAERIHINLGEAITKKLAKSSKKYPVKLVKGDKRLENYRKLKLAARHARKKSASRPTLHK